MKPFKVIDRKNLPTRLRWDVVLLVVLALDHWKASTLSWWLAMTILFCLFAVNLNKVRHEREVKIFEEEDPDASDIPKPI